MDCHPDQRAEPDTLGSVRNEPGDEDMKME